MRNHWRPPPTERDARVELAAAYRAASVLGWTDLGSTHFSARVPGEPDAYLMLQRDFFFDEVTASNLVKIGFDGELRSAGVGPDQVDPDRINRAGVTIHGALHSGAPNVHAVLHTHSRTGLAVSCHPEGLLSLSQHAMRFHARQGIHPYEGIADDGAEGPRLVEHLADNELLILQNHGLITVGSSVPAAFSALYYAEMACQMQVDILAGNPDGVVRPSDEICEITAKQYEASTGYQFTDWLGVLRMVERAHPDFSQ